MSAIELQASNVANLSYINDCGDAYTKINKDLYVR